MHRSRKSCRPMFGTTQRRSVTTTGRFVHYARILNANARSVVWQVVHAVARTGMRERSRTRVAPWRPDAAKTAGGTERVFQRNRPEAVIRSGFQARGTARASLSVVTHPEHEIFHALNERMFPFNLVSGVVEPHVVHRTLALTCNDLHDVLSKGLAGGISCIA
jgi:hypothetical protein